MDKTVKESDIRYTSDNLFNLLKIITKIDWKKAYDPTPISAKSNTLDQDWNQKKNIFLNPPFSKSRLFIPKLMDEMEKHKKIKKALIIMPWYQVESKETRVSNRPQWVAKEFQRMKKYDTKIFHLKNQDFYNPFLKKMTQVRVYATFIQK